MGIAERRTREKEELRAKIMDAATELFVQEGRESVSIRKIAEKIEYAPSTIYLYFDDKNKLLMTIVEETFERLSAGLDEVAQRALPPVEALFAGIRLYIQFGIDHPNQYYLAFCTIPDTDLPPESCQGVTEAALRALDHLRRALERCIEAGYIARQDTNVLTQSVWMMMHGLTSAVIFKDYDKGVPWASTEQLVEKTIEILKGGLLTQVPSKN